MPESTKRLFIQTIPCLPLFGVNCVPTAIYYRKEQEPLVGFRAEEAAQDPLEVNRDFKVDLGQFRPSGTANPQRFRTAVGEEKSAVVFTGDFLRCVLIEASRFLRESRIEQAT